MTQHIAIRKRWPRLLRPILLSMLTVFLLGCPNPVNDGDGSGSTAGSVTVNVTETTTGSGTNEAQRISAPVASGGSFRLTFDDGSIAPGTGDLFVDATVGEVQAALEQLRSIDGASNVVVSGSDGGPWDIEFTGALAAAEQNEITVDGTALISSMIPPEVSEVAEGGGGQNEAQLISSTNANGGTFALVFDDGTSSETTANIGIDATTSYVNVVLQGLSNVPGGAVSVTGSTGGPWQVEFVGGGLEATNLPLMVVDSSNLTGNPVVTEHVPHVAGGNEVQTIEFSPAAGGGEFTLSFGGETTVRLPYDATAATVESALQKLVSVPGNSVSVASTAATGGPWQVEFTGRLAATDHELISGDTSELAPAAIEQ